VVTTFSPALTLKLFILPTKSISVRLNGISQLVFALKIQYVFCEIRPETFFIFCSWHSGFNELNFYLIFNFCRLHSTSAYWMVRNANALGKSQNRILNPQSDSKDANIFLVYNTRSQKLTQSTGRIRFADSLHISALKETLCRTRHVNPTCRKHRTFLSGICLRTGGPGFVPLPTPDTRKSAVWQSVSCAHNAFSSAYVSEN
jgi:hypothetical protein